ncbi:MAG TPA: hypothetical protein DD421_07170, partial [Clostridiaceae bacterium]|nr:hypothetical protein [Clostridiaceae bacterium]
SKCYITAYTMTEGEMLEALCMERSNFYIKKKEAIKLFGIALWGYALPRYQELLIENNEYTVHSNSYFY